jgi:hypothetical protein
MIKYPGCEIGDVVEVFSVFGGYPLPYGLSEGMQVRVQEKGCLMIWDRT